MIGLRGHLITLMFSELPRHPELRGAVGGLLRIFGEIVGLIGRYQSEGKLRPGPPGQAMTALLISEVIGGFTPMVAMPDAGAHVRVFLEGRANA